MDGLSRVTKETEDVIVASHSLPTFAMAVQEAIQNALDAEASKITVTIAFSQSAFSIVDDGNGIPATGLRETIGVSRASRSMIQKVKHRGRRGQFLLMLATLGSVQITSRAVHSWATLQKVIQNGVVKSIRKVTNDQTRSGTTLTVHGLFDRLPVRTKSIKRDIKYQSQVVRKIQGFCRIVSIIRPQLDLTVHFQDSSNPPIRIMKVATYNERLLMVFGQYLYNDLKYKRLVSPEESMSVHGYFGLIFTTPNDHPKVSKEAKAYYQYVYFGNEWIDNFHESCAAIFNDAALAYSAVPIFILKITCNAHACGFSRIDGTKSVNVHHRSDLEDLCYEYVHICLERNRADSNKGCSPFMNSKVKADLREPLSELDIDTTYHEHIGVPGEVTFDDYLPQSTPMMEDKQKYLEEEYGCAFFGPSQENATYSMMTSKSKYSSKRYAGRESTLLDDDRYFLDACIHDMEETYFPCHFHTEAQSHPDVSHLECAGNGSKSVSVSQENIISSNRSHSTVISKYMKALTRPIQEIWKERRSRPIQTSRDLDEVSLIAPTSFSQDTPFTPSKYFQPTRIKGSQKSGMLPKLSQVSGIVQSKAPTTDTSGCQSTTSCKLDRDSLANFRTLGQVDNKFILVVQESQDAPCQRLLCIDQHAADERIRLELMENELIGDDGSLHPDNIHEHQVPIQLHLNIQEVQTVRHHQDYLAKWGFRCTISDTSTLVSPLEHAASNARQHSSAISLLSSPMIDRRVATTGDFRELLVHVMKYPECPRDSSRPHSITRLLHSRACRGAIMFGDPLSLRSCERIIQGLRGCNLPFQCAHGRPSVVPLMEFSSRSRSQDE